MQEYYKEIHTSLGLMLIFPEGGQYYVNASSSSIATALITETPMIVDQHFLDVHTFIPAAAVIVSNATSHAKALQHVLSMTADAWNEMSSAVSSTNDALMLIS